MVEDRVTDGKRIAQLLASELSGRSNGGLADVSVVEAAPDADPTSDGTVAYRVAVRDVVVAAAVMYPEFVALELGDTTEEGAPPLDAAAVRERARSAGLAVETAGDARIRVPSGAAVKRAIDALRAGF